MNFSIERYVNPRRIHYIRNFKIYSGNGSNLMSWQHILIKGTILMQCENQLYKGTVLLETWKTNSNRKFPIISNIHQVLSRARGTFLATVSST